MSGYYEDYLIYSRYDHYGIQSQIILTEAPEKKIERLKRGVRMLALQSHFIYSLLSLNCPDSILKEIYDATKAYIEQVLSSNPI